MKIIYNKFIPLKGFKAMMLFGLLFVRKGATMNEADMNHEKIHAEQYREMTSTGLLAAVLLSVFGLWWTLLVAPLAYYIWYVVEWIVRLAIIKDAHAAYRNISFEREAYANETDLEYLSNRKGYAFLDFFIH